jgi:hypothetical protein
MLPTEGFFLALQRPTTEYLGSGVVAFYCLENPKVINDG